MAPWAEACKVCRPIISRMGSSLVMEHLVVPQGRFALTRLPKRRRERLRAWDAADEYLLESTAGLAPGANVLVANDSFGALAVPLVAHGCRVTSWSDSWLAAEATRENLGRHRLPQAGVSLLPSVRDPVGPFDVVVMRVPKTLGLLEDQLIRLRPQLGHDARIYLGGMIKALPKTLWDLLERLIGATDTAPGLKKAKVIQVSPDAGLPVAANPYPVTWGLVLGDEEWPIRNHAAVFSRDSLDIGTRFFLEHLPKLPAAQDIVDLGCGNGVLGLVAGRLHPQARVTFVDESHMAVLSARENWQAVHGDHGRALFVVGDGLADAAPGSADLVLCNPPFHQQQAVGDHLAQRMFRQARHALRPGGELWVVGNRHLRHDVTLKQLFGGCELVASNPKFVVLRAVR